MNRHVGALVRSLAILLLMSSFPATLACADPPPDGTEQLAGRAGEGGKGSAGPARAVREALRADVLFPGGRRFAAEIADTSLRQARGYMRRAGIGPDEAMVFVFQALGVRTFWMKNVLVPLDMIWMDETFRIVHIDHAVPPCRADPCSSYGTIRATRYVLEVAGGIARAEELAVGDRLQITLPELPRQ